MQRILSEIENRHKSLVLLPRNLQVGREVLVQVPDIHIHTGEGSLNFLLRIFIIPNIFIYIQIGNLSRKIDKQFQLIILFIWMVDICTFLLQFIIERNTLETGFLLALRLNLLRSHKVLLLESLFALLHKPLKNSIIRLGLQGFLLFL